MSTKSSKIKNIVTVNAYDKKYYVLKNREFTPLNKLTYNSANLVASYINSHDLITASLEVSRSVPQEDIADVIEIKAYEELGLDQAEEYIIRYTERAGEGDVRTFDLFVVEPEILESTFSEVVHETKYIDLLIPAPLLYRSLYDKELLASEGVHCFIYFGENDTFVTFYRNGQYLYSKSIEYSLEQIYDKYCELVGERVNEEQFFNILETEGLKTIHADYQQNLMKLFGDIFIQINDIVIYAKRAYDLTKIDQMFIGSVKGPIAGLDEYSENYLGLQSSELIFDFGLESSEWYTDQLQSMLAVSAVGYLENVDSVVNLTIFERAPAFHKRASGQFIIATLLAIMAGISYPIYFLVGSYMNDATNMVLTQNESKLNRETTKYKGILSAKKREIKRLDGKIANLSKIYHVKERTLTAIYNKKVNYQLRSDFIAGLSNLFHHYNIYLARINSIDKKFNFAIYSQDEKNITELVKYISLHYMDKIKSINIEMISTMAYTADKYAKEKNIDTKKLEEINDKIAGLSKKLTEEKTKMTMMEKMKEDTLLMEQLDSEKTLAERISTEQGDRIVTPEKSETGQIKKTSESNVKSAKLLIDELWKQKRESLTSQLAKQKKEIKKLKLSIEKKKSELSKAMESIKIDKEDKTLIEMATVGTNAHSLDNGRDINEDKKYFTGILKVELR